MKVLQISGFMKSKDKFGNDQYQIDGLAYGIFQNYHGTPSKRVWVRCDRVGRDLSDQDLHKNLYLEYNEKGYVISCEIK